MASKGNWDQDPFPKKTVRTGAGGDPMSTKVSKPYTKGGGGPKVSKSGGGKKG